MSYWAVKNGRACLFEGIRPGTHWSNTCATTFTEDGVEAPAVEEDEADFPIDVKRCWKLIGSMTVVELQRAWQYLEQALIKHAGKPVGRPMTDRQKLVKKWAKGWTKKQRIIEARLADLKSKG